MLLLTNSQYKIGEISEKVGFMDEKYFSKIFKKATAKTPQHLENIQDYRIERRHSLLVAAYRIVIGS
jgi:transcriptional regulator GlxA family with amidase domain